MSSDKAGDVRLQSITQVLEENRGRLRSVVGRLVRDDVEVDDVLQDVFAEFIESYDLGTAIESAGAWLVRVARNKVFDRFRRKKTQEEHRRLVQASAEDLEKFEPANDWLRDQTREALIGALEELPPEQLDVFVRHELQGQSFEEISAETGVGVNTLLSRKRYAILFLREHLKEIYDELE